MTTWCFDKFNCDRLPPEMAFRDILYDEGISKDDYKHAQTVRKTFNITKMGE